MREINGQALGEKADGRKLGLLLKTLGKGKFLSTSHFTQHRGSTAEKSIRSHAYFFFCTEESNLCVCVNFPVHK